MERKYNGVTFSLANEHGDDLTPEHPDWPEYVRAAHITRVLGDRAAAEDDEPASEPLDEAE